jgi:hypothetical protein
MQNLQGEVQRQNLKTLIRTALLILLTTAAACAETGEPVKVAFEGWTVTADGAKGVLDIAHDTIGTLMRDVRLNLQETNGLRHLKNWSVEKKGEHQLSIKTADPRSAWLIDLGPHTLKISCTLSDAVVTANAPASKDRVIARLMDPEGVPVTWVGTDEVAHGYGGSETRNPSFLPTRNPECMYFGLGQVAGANFHSLFDRRTDTAIRFSDETLMERSRQNRDSLDLTIPVPGSTLIRLFPDYYMKILGLPFYVPFDDSRFSKAPTVWSSWTSYYCQVKEQDIVRNADWIAANLKPYGFEYVELDEGYDGKNNVGESVGEDHEWIGEWDRKKFPNGPKWLTAYIKSKGLRAGMWLVPNAYAGAVEQHPGWYLRDKQGNIIRDYNTPALDSTNPEVLDFLKKLFTTLDDWGFEYYKFDGEHALPKYVPAVDRNTLYDKSIDPLVAYRNRLKVIRETIGPGRFIEGCPAGTPLNGIGYMNSYFNGQDVYNSWQGMHNLFSSINANAFLNHIAVYVMPGEGMELGPPMTVDEAKQKRPASVLLSAHTREDPVVGFGTTLAEAHTVISHVALTGVAYPMASVMPELPDNRVKLLKATLPTMPIVPVDLFSRGTDAKYDTFRHTQADYYIHTYPQILDLKVNAKSGIYDVVGLTNWRSGTVARTISFVDKLGLNAGSSYVAFDFWGQKLYGVFKDRMEVEIEPHDTRVFLIHPVLNRPQLVGISRHITGAYSILDLAWDAARNRLSGSSETVPGETYTLFIYVPQGVTVSKIGTRSKGNREVPASHEVTANTLKVSFRGQPDAVDWQVEFSGSHGQAKSTQGNHNRSDVTPAALR